MKSDHFLFFPWRLRLSLTFFILQLLKDLYCEAPFSKPLCTLSCARFPDCDCSISLRVLPNVLPGAANSIKPTVILNVPFPRQVAAPRLVSFPQRFLPHPRAKNVGSIRFYPVVERFRLSSMTLSFNTLLLCLFPTRVIPDGKTLDHSFIIDLFGFNFISLKWGAFSEFVFSPADGHCPPSVSHLVLFLGSMPPTSEPSLTQPHPPPPLTYDSFFTSFFPFE